MKQMLIKPQFNHVSDTVGYGFETSEGWFNYQSEASNWESVLGDRVGHLGSSYCIYPCPEGPNSQSYRDGVGDGDTLDWVQKCCLTSP